MNFALYAIWQNHNVIGYIRLTPEQATALNKIKNLGVYFGFDETTKMTLEGAIAHAQEVTKTADCAECREEHQQLGDWLTELKEIKEEKKMNAKKCDRCKKFYVYDFYGVTKGKSYANGAFLVYVDAKDCYEIKQKCDLCPDCMQKLREFLEGEK